MADTAEDQPKKVKKTRTPEQLEALARAREKALEIRKQNAELRKAEKELAKQEKEQNIKERKERVKKLLKEEPIKEVEEDTPDPEPPAPKPKAKPKKKKVIVVEESESESEEEEVVVVKKKKAPKARVAERPPPINQETREERLKQFRRKKAEQNYDNLYKQMFGGR